MNYSIDPVEDNAVKLEAPENNDVRSRASPIKLDTFSDGSSYIEMNLTAKGANSDYYNSTVSVRIPKNAEIQSASMDIEGLSTPITDNVIDRIDPTDNVRTTAYAGLEFSDPPTSPLQTLKSFYVFNTTHRGNVSADDLLYVVNRSGAIGSHAFHMFEINLTAFQFSAVNVTWLGHGVRLSPPVYYGAKLFYWKGTNFEPLVVLVGGGGTDYNISVVIDDPNMLDTGGSMHLLALSPGQNDTELAEIYTDYIEVRTLRNGTGISFPYNLSLDVSDDGSSDAQLLNELKSSVPVTQNLVTAFQNAVDLAGPGYGEVVVNINFSSERAGRLNLSNLEIIYNLDVKPVLTGNVPNSTVILEDSGWTQSSINLNNYFTDSFGLENLTYNVVYKQDESKVDTIVYNFPQQAHLYFYTDGDFYGTSEFRFSATNKGADGIAGNSDDMTTQTNSFHITVAPTNDAPEIYQLEFAGSIKKAVTGNSTSLILGSHKAFEDTLYTMGVKASDIDDDELSYTCNITDGIGTDDNPRFVLNSETGNITFSPLIDDVGILYFNITVSDQNDSVPGTDHLNVELYVSAVNDPPVISTHGPVLAYEDRWNYYDIEAADEDDEQLIYSSNRSDGKGADEFSDFSINRDTGVIAFMPTQAEVGDFWANITVADIGGRETYLNLRIVVLDVNDAPQILNVGTLSVEKYEFNLFEVQEGDWLNLTVTAVDEENDELTFNAVPTAPTNALPENFSLDTKNGNISFMAPVVSAVSHLTFFINLTVDDGNDFNNNDFVWLELQVENTNDPPQITGIDHTVDNGAVTFTIKGSDPDGDSVKAVWNYGDGGPSVITYILNSKRSYPGPGNYKVKVTLIDSHNASSFFVLDLNLTEDDFPKKPDIIKPDDESTGMSTSFKIAIAALIINIIILTFILFFIFNRRKRMIHRRRRLDAEKLLRESGTPIDVRSDKLGKRFEPGSGTADADDESEPKKGPIQTTLARFGELFGSKKDDE